MQIRIPVLDSLFCRKSCPIPAPGQRRSRLALRHFIPLIGFVLPTVIVGYGLVIPKSCIAGVNALTIGFATTILGACVTYAMGIRAALSSSVE
jgi:hypothetical protein